MAQQQQVGRIHTTVKKLGDYLRVTYHSTDVVTVTDKEILLYTGGYYTATTRTRMNQASNQFDLGYRVYQENFKWFAWYKGKKHPFIGNSLTLLK